MFKTLDHLAHYTMTDKYYANEHGEVFFNRNTGRGSTKRLKDDKVKPFKNKYGYTEYILDDEVGNRKHIQAHRITASLFIQQIDLAKTYVNHIDGNKENNFKDNLEWCTAKENEAHSHSVLGKQVWNKGLTGLRQNKPNPVERYSIDGVLEKHYNSPRDTEEDGYSLKQVSAACNGTQKTHKGKIWKFKKVL